MSNKTELEAKVLESQAELEAYFEEIAAAHDSVHASHHASSPKQKQRPGSAL